MHLESLQKGDIVDVVAPAWACKSDELRRALKALREWGLVPRVPHDLFARGGAFANTDAIRLKNLRRALHASDSKMVWCVRGGYGSMRLLPELECLARPPVAKIFLGYSDITSLHVFLNQKWKWPTLHGPVLERLGRDVMSTAERHELSRILFGRGQTVEFRALKTWNAAARATRVVRAPVVGGNLTVVQCGMATPNELRPRGRILFFEDTGERPYRVDRMLTQMSQAGWFDECRAVLFGHFLLGREKEKRELWNDVIPRFAASVKVPVLSGLPVGHNSKRQRTLPFGTSAELHLGRSPVLQVPTGVK